MSQNWGFRIQLLFIALGGIFIAWLRHGETGIPFFPGQEHSVWQVEARIDFDAEGGPVTASLSLPEMRLPGFELFHEQAASPGYGFTILEKGDSRRAEWTQRSAEGPQSLYYSAQFVESATAQAMDIDAAVEVYPVDWDEVQELAAKSVLEEATKLSSTPASLTRQLIRILNSDTNEQNAALLRASNTERAELVMILLGRAGIPTRSIMALYLEDARRRQGLSPMLEVLSDGQWYVFNPETGEEGVAKNLLLWHRGGVSVLDVTGGRGSRVSFSMIRQSVPALQLARVSEGDSLFADMGLYRLPIEEQSMFKLLLLLPLGAAVVVFVRVIVGFRTAGTFMPILISLVFMQTSLVPGLLSFVGVVAIGLLLRGYLSRLNLLMVSRLATLIVLVIFLISLISIIGYQLGYNTGMTITFFPMIIIAWTIERMSVLWEEEGAQEVLIQSGGSLFVAVVAYLFMQSAMVQHLSFNFPELNLVLLALILAMGQYTGYKLTELRRFRAMDQLR